jgi:hypothetical protein
VIGDVTCQRIDQLTSSFLECHATDWTGWDSLYRDPRDGRLWERTYPESAIHGGGPPALTVVPFEYAVGKYDLIGDPTRLITSRRDLEDALASYLAVLAGSAEETSSAENRAAYTKHLAAAAQMFVALRHERSLVRLQEIVDAERRALGWGYLGGDEGAKAEAAWEAFASKVQSLSPSA